MVPLKNHATLALLALVATLPLVWIVIVRIPLGEVKFAHVAAIALVGASLASSATRRTVLDVTRSHSGLVAAVGAYVVILLGADFIHERPAVPELRQLLYATTGLFVAGAMLAALRDPSGRSRRFLSGALAWGLGCLLLVFGMAALSKGVNVGDTVIQGIAAGDPSIIEYQLFREVFEGQGYVDEEVRTNLRHEVFAAILVAAWLSTYLWRLRPARSTAHRLGRSIGLVAFVGLTLVSLSRSVILTLALVILLGLVATIARARITSFAAIVTPLAIAAVFGLTAAGVSDILWERVTQESGSYETRASASTAGFDAVTSSPLIGVDDLEVSSHNFVIEALARGGILAGIAAAAVFLIILQSICQQVLRLIRGSPTATSLGVLGLGLLVLVRMLTSGGGQLALAEWVALGIYLAILFHDQRASGVPPRSRAGVLSTELALAPRAVDSRLGNRRPSQQADDPSRRRVAGSARASGASWG